MPQPLPLRANLEWLKKLCKERHAALCAADPGAKLSNAQLAVAREFGFPSWRKVKAHVELRREKLAALVPADTGQREKAGSISSDDPELAQLFAAIDAGDMQAVSQLLTRRPALAAARGRDGQTPLHAAAQCNDNRLAVYLMACGADPEAKYGQSGHTALSWAVTCNSIEFARTLVRLGSKPDLFCAAGIGSTEDVAAFFDESGTLRPGASRTGSTRLAADGTRLPCPPEIPSEQVSDALYVAARNAHVEVVRLLLAKQPDLAFKAYMGGTALHWAHFGGSPEVIGLLEQAGADPAARDDVLHCTPRAFGICAPVSWGFTERVHRRLAADPTLSNFMDGRTSPLHEAARAGKAEIVRFLLDANADPTLRDGDGKTPIEVAAERGHAGVVEMLRQAGATGPGRTA